MSAHARNKNDSPGPAARACDLLRRVGIVPDPAYYSGRGPHCGDVTLGHLQRLADLIEAAHGKQARAAFRRLVAAVKPLTATRFLIALSRLEQAGWRWRAALAPDTNVALNGPDDVSATLLAALTSGRPAGDPTAMTQLSFALSEKRRLTWRRR